MLVALMSMIASGGASTETTAKLLWCRLRENAVACKHHHLTSCRAERLSSVLSEAQFTDLVHLVLSFFRW